LKPTTVVNGTRQRGVGVGAHGNADIGEDASEAYVRLHPDKTAMLFSGVTEHGTGQRSNFVKMVAEVLQMPLERISVTPSGIALGTDSGKPLSRLPIYS
jgi:CO/xanthine dehydrogenase Mo-binding subunit